MNLITRAQLSPREKRWLLVLLLPLLLSCYVHFVAGNSTDKNWLLFAASKWMAGGRLYIDIFEVNPPLIIWLYTAPVFLAAYLNFFSAFNWLAVLTFALVALVLKLCARLLALHPGFEGEAKKQLGFLLLMAYVLVFCTAPMYFSDREHLFLTLTLPYILRFCPGIARLRLPYGFGFIIGLLAAIGFCIKPHTLVVFSVLQLLYLIRERSPAILWSLENLVVYIVGGAYVASVILFMPEYVHIILPMALATYSAYSQKANGVYNIIVFVVITGITFADFKFRYRSPYRAGVYYLLGTCAAFLAYGLTNNGWAYTYIPLLSTARLLAGWVLLEFIWLKKDAEAAGKPTRPFVFGIRSTGVNLFLNALFYLICFIAYLTPTDCGKTVSCKGSVLFFKEARQRPVHSFGTMSLEYYKWPELVHETGALWQTRFNHLWMIPKFELQGPAFKTKNAWIIDYVAKAYAEDLNTHRPEVVYVDTSPELFHGHPNIDLAGYFSGNAEFREAWGHYHKTDVIDACVKAPRGEPDEASLKIDCRFAIYSRLPAP